MPGHPRPPLCRDKAGSVQGFQNTLPAAGAVPSSQRHWPLCEEQPHPTSRKSINRGPYQALGHPCRDAAESTRLPLPPSDKMTLQSWARASPSLGVPRPPIPSTLTDIQGAGIWTLGKGHSFIKLIQHFLLGLGDGVTVQDLHGHALGFSCSVPHSQQRVQGLCTTRGGSQGSRTRGTTKMSRPRTGTTREEATASDLEAPHSHPLVSLHLPASPRTAVPSTPCPVC